MEHRKFKRRLAELVEELTPAQARKLIDAMSDQGAMCGRRPHCKEILA